MIHERALQAALAGGPILAELARHIEECPECRKELADLQALEGELRHAAPRVPFRPAWPGRLVSRSAPAAPPLRAWTSWAASVLLAAALLSTWLSLGPGSPGRQNPLPGNTTALAQSAETSPQLASLPSLMWDGNYEDSTAALLDMVEPLAEEMPKTPPEAITNYLSPSDTGGWNG